ncbi:MAG: hypothetical protein HY908_18440 [Myxococcales bacterium]|nr:hypothetical protein [Myxococcales bacterium]
MGGLARAGALGLGLGLGLFGCGGAELPPLALESEHFRLHAYPDDPICARILEGVEQHYAAVAGYLGLALEDGARFDIYKYRDEAELAAKAPCPEAAHGCAGEGKIYVATVTSAPFEHELVHAYASLAGYAPTLFEEGLAIMLQEWDGLGPGERPPHFGSAPLESAVAEEQWDALDPPPSAAAGSFVRFLVDGHGVPAFEALRRSTPHDASRDEVDAFFCAAMVEPVASAIAQWRAGDAASGWLPVADCAAEPLPVGEPSVLGELPCGRARRSLVLPDAAGLVVRVRHESSVSVHLRPCDGGRPMWPSDWSVSSFYPPGEQHELWASLPAGAYGLEAGAYAPGPEATPLIELDGSPGAGDRCEDAAEREIPPETRRVDVPLAFASLADDGGEPGRADAFVRFRVAAARRVTVAATPADVFADGLFADGADHTTRRFRCSAGCPAADCVEMTSAAFDVAAGEAVTLVLEGGPTDRRTFGLGFDPPPGG